MRTSPCSTRAIGVGIGPHVASVGERYGGPLAIARERAKFFNDLDEPGSAVVVGAARVRAFHRLLTQIKSFVSPAFDRETRRRRSPRQIDTTRASGGFILNLPLRSDHP